MPNNAVATITSARVKPRFDFLEDLKNIILNAVLGDVSDVRSRAMNLSGLPGYNDGQSLHLGGVAHRTLLGGKVCDRSVHSVNGWRLSCRVVIIRLGRGWNIAGDDPVPIEATDGFRALEHDLGGALIFAGHLDGKQGIAEG